MTAPTATGAGPAAYGFPPVLGALVPHAVMLAVVLSGGLDLAGFTTALALEALLYSLLLFDGRRFDDYLTHRHFISGPPLLVAAGGALRAEWDPLTLLALIGFLASVAVTLALRCRRAGRVFGVVTREDYFLRTGSAVLALLMLLGSASFVRLSEAGWSPSDAGFWSWPGSQIVRVGDLVGLSPEVALTATMVVFFAFNEALAAALANLGGRRDQPADPLSSPGASAPPAG